MSLLSRFKDITGFGKVDGEGAGDTDADAARRRAIEDAPPGYVAVAGRPMHEMVRGMKPDRSVEDSSAGDLRRRILGLDDIEVAADDGRAVGTSPKIRRPILGMGLGMAEVRATPMEDMVRREDPSKIRRPILGMGMAEVRATPMEEMVRQPVRPRSRPEPVSRLKDGDPADGAESLARVPKTEDLKAVTDMMLGLYGKAPGDEVMKALGRPDRRDPDMAPPPPGGRRDRWIAERVAIAFDPQRDTMTHPAHSQEHNPPLRTNVEFHVARKLREEYEPGTNLISMAAARRAQLSANIVDFMQEGPRLEQRVHSETEHLVRRTDSQIDRRFAMSPISSMKPMPEDVADRREWISDALRAEHAAARAGMMHGPAISIAANAERGQTPYAPHAPMPKVDWSRLSRQDAENAREAAQLDRLPDQGLRSRFRDVPGVDRARIPPVGEADRRIWIEVAVQAQKVRDVMPKPVQGVAEDIGRLHPAREAASPARQPIKEIEMKLDRFGKDHGKRPPPPAMAAHLVRQNGM